MFTNLARAKELQAIVVDLEKDVTALELATKALIGSHLGEDLEVDASLGVRQRIKFMTATIKDIT
jgi:hypothetical protein